MNFEGTKSNLKHETLTCENIHGNYFELKATKKFSEEIKRRTNREMDFGLGYFESKYGDGFGKSEK